MTTSLATMHTLTTDCNIRFLTTNPKRCRNVSQCTHTQSASCARTHWFIMEVEICSGPAIPGPLSASSFWGECCCLRNCFCSKWRGGGRERREGEGRRRKERRGEDRGRQGRESEKGGGGGERGGEEEWVVRKGIRYIHKRMLGQECPQCLLCVEHWDHAQTESQTGQLCLWPATSTIMTHLYVRHQSAMTPAIIKFSAT